MFYVGFRALDTCLALGVLMYESLIDLDRNTTAANLRKTTWSDNVAYLEPRKLLVQTLNP